MPSEKQLAKINDLEEEESDVESVSSYDEEDEDDFLNPEFASILGTHQRIAAPKTPTAMFGLTVPAGGEPVPLIEDDEVAQAVRITMAAIDVADESSTKACQLKVIRRPIFDDDSEDEDEESIDEEEVAMYTEEYTLCTLKPGVIYQQVLDVTFSEGEMIYFASTGDCDIHITGNYMTPIDEVPDAYDSEDDSELDEELDSEDDEEDEDISESDLIAAEAEEDSEEEEDALDEIDARISALEEAEASSKKSKKRRASAGDDDLDAVMDDAAAEEEAPKKLSKKDRKKLKAANGEAVAAPATSSSAATAASEDSEDSAKKSVSFSNDTKPAAKLVSGGLSIEDRKQGEGPSVKHGAKVAIRYVGKLKSNGKQFDANSKGKPFTFSVGKGEVIKGMELGVVGMKAGGERRVTIPAAMAYGKKSLPGIPANSDLVFDIKLLKF